MAIERIARLAVEIGASIKAFTSKMAIVNKTSARIGKGFARLGRVAAGVSKKIAGVAKRFRKSIFSMKGAILGLVGGVVIKKIAGFITSIVNMGDQFAKTAKKIGIGVETLSGLKLATDLAGTSFTALVGGFRRLSASAFDAKNGLAESQRAFDALGVSVVDNQGQLRSLEDLFFDSADALAAMTNDTERAAVAQDLFGRAGLDLIPLLKQGSKEIRRQIKLAKELGITFSKKDAKAAEEFNDQMTLLKAVFTGFASTIVKEITPAFAGFFKMMREDFSATKSEGGTFAKDIGGFIKGLLFTTIGAIELMKSAWSGLNVIFLGVGKILTGLGAVFVNVGIRILSVVRDIVSSISGPFDKAFNSVLTLANNFVRALLIGITSGLSKILDAVAKSLNELAALAAKVNLDKAREFSGILSSAGQKATKTSDKIFALGQNILKTTASFQGLENPAIQSLGAIDSAISKLGDANETLRQELAFINDELLEIANSEVIPFWERARQKILELNAAMIESQIQTREQGVVDAEEAEKRVKAIEEQKKKFGDFFGGLSVGIKQFTQIASQAFQGFASGFGDAIAESLVFGEDFVKSMKALIKDLAATIISQLVTIIITALVAQAALSLFGIGAPTDVAATAAKATASVGEALGNIGVGTLGSLAIPFADGGIVTSPTLALIGEAGPEAVIPLNRGGGMGMQQTIVIEMDSREIARATAENLPSVLRVEAGLS